MDEQELWMQPPVGPEQAAEAERILHKYKAGKAALDRRLIDNELWFRMAHWKQYKNRMMEGKPQPSSGWLFNSIASKHADAMDNYPEPNVLPRAADDEATARTLSSILPVVLEQADYEQVYSDSWWRKLKQGTGVKGIFWDPAARGGMGEIAIRSMNLLMLYWEPGVMDIQDSPHFFSLSLEDSEQLAARWPQLRGRTGGTIDAARYIHDDSIDTTDKSVVVDWYYKKPGPGGRELVHYCKFCNGVVLYASENDPRLAERGFYDHGKYPFVFDVLFQEEDSPAGFGYIDVMKDCQTSIDRLNQAMDENVLLASKQRYVLSDAAGVNEEELADLSRDIVHVTGRLSDDSFHQMQTAGLDHLPQQPGGRAEGDQRQPRHQPGRRVGRGDGGIGHRRAAGGGQQAEPGHDQERVQGLRPGVLSGHRPDAAVLRRGAGLSHHGGARAERLRPLQRGGAAACAGQESGRGGAGQPGAGVRHHHHGGQKEHLQPADPERDGQGVLPAGLLQPGQRRRGPGRPRDDGL